MLSDSFVGFCGVLLSELSYRVKGCGRKKWEVVSYPVIMSIADIVITLPDHVPGRSEQVPHCSPPAAD